MKGQLKRGWQAVALFAVTAAVGFGQTNMGAPGANGYPASGNYPAGNYPGANQPTQQQPAMGNRGGRMASPGTINYVEGNVSLNGQALPQRSSQAIVAGPNQVIDTADGYVEVLLTPGAFLRIGHNAEVRFANEGLAGVDMQLNHGSAMIEVAQLVKGSELDVTLSGAKTRIDEKGLYAFDADQHSVKVLEGKAQVMENAGETTLHKDDAVFLASYKPLRRRGFDVKAEKEEALYVWSRVRSEDEAEENVSLARSYAMNGGFAGPGWYYSPYWADYAFLPGAGFLYSPFGFGFYSPFAYYGGFGYGFYGRGFYGARVGGVGAGVHAFAGGGGRR